MSNNSNKEIKFMTKKLLLMLTMTVMLLCVFAFSVSAATTDEFGEAELIDGIDLTDMSTDTTSRVVLTDGNGNYYTYPSQYIVTKNGTFTYDFSKINAKGYSYSVSSVIRIEVPTTVTAVPTDGGTNPLTRYNTIEIYFPENSTITKFSYGCFANSPKLQKINVPKSVTEFNTYKFYNSKAITEINFHKDSQITTIPANTFKGCSGLLSLTIPNTVTTVADRSLDFGQNQVITELRLSANLVDFGEMHFAWNQYKDKIFRIYAPETFLANETAITSPVYDKQGTFTSYPSSMYSVCIYFTGDKAHLDALISKSSYDKFTNATLVEYDPNKSDEEYGALNTWTVVYNYNSCKAFYNNEHSVSQDKLTLKYNSYTEAFSEVCACAKNCGLEAVVNEYAPIFTFVGYSVKENDTTALCAGYTVNHASMAVYKKYNTNATLSYGIVASTPNEDGSALLKSENGNVLAIKSTTVVANVDTSYAGYDFVLRGFNDDNKDTALVICSYIFDGTSIMYMTDACTATVPTAITYSEVLTKQEKEN